MIEKRLDGYSKYLISQDGTIKSFAKKWLNSPRILKPIKSKTLGYFYISMLHDDGILKRLLVHRIIAELFIDNPHHYPMINHLDGNPSNNKIENLEWCDQNRNMMHSYYELKKQGCKNREIVQMDMDGNILKVWPSVNRASKELGYSSTSAIWQVLQGRSSYSKGYRWAYQ